MSGIFSSPKPAAAPPAPRPDNSPEIAQARAEERKRLASAKGRSSTMLGGSLSDQGGAKRLLGQ